MRESGFRLIPSSLFFSLHRYRPQSHTTGSSDRRQKCRECSYYHLHRQLNHPLLFHNSSFFCVIISPPKLGGARGGLKKRII